jgi:hypothetical protein
LKLLLAIGLKKFFLQTGIVSAEHHFAARAVFGDFQIAFVS